MKTILTVFLILIAFSLNNLHAQSLKQTIRGKVKDIDSEVTLIGVTLHIEDSDPIIGTITDNDGYFKFQELPIGRYNVVVSYLGYENKIIPKLEASATL